MDAPVPAYVHVAQVSGEPVTSAPYLEAQWKSVAALLGPAGVQLAPSKLRTPNIPARIEGRRERSALAQHAVAGAVNVFVVESLADIDEPGRYRLGVHWRAGGTHYVIVATYAVPGGQACPPQYRCTADNGLLAHELGHFFRLAHDPRGDNLMSYTREGKALWLDERQLRVVRRAYSFELSSGSLRP